MTDTQPIQDGSQGMAGEAQTGDESQGRDSLQEQARRETSKAEGEDRSFGAAGDQAQKETGDAMQDDPNQDRSQG